MPDTLSSFIAKRLSGLKRHFFPRDIHTYLRKSSGASHCWCTHFLVHIGLMVALILVQSLSGTRWCGGGRPYSGALTFWCSHFLVHVGVVAVAPGEDTSQALHLAGLLLHCSWVLTPIVVWYTKCTFVRTPIMV